jgi:membrane protease YdiL (CAAX protease family)
VLIGTGLLSNFLDDLGFEGSRFVGLPATAAFPILPIWLIHINLKPIIHILLNNMSNLYIWDHVFAIAVFNVFPIYSKLTIVKVLDDIRERGEIARLRAYRGVIVTWIAFSICVLAGWWYFDRDWAELGIRGAEPLRLALAFAVACVIVAAMAVQLRNLARLSDGVAEIDSQLGETAQFMPQSKLEDRWFKVVSTNAGLSEELIFRGYLIWYLGHYVGIGWAATIAVVAFAFAHIYQGVRQLPGLLLVSAVTVSLYVYTESLLVPVLFHIALDATQGHYIAKIRRQKVAAN